MRVAVLVVLIFCTIEIDSFTIGNSLIELQFQNDTFGLQNIFNLLEKNNRRGFFLVDRSSSLWSAEILKKDLNTKKTSSYAIQSNDLKDFATCQFIKFPSSEEKLLTAVFTWTKFSITDTQIPIEIQLNITLKRNDPITYWRASAKLVEDDSFYHFSVWNFAIAALGALGSSDDETNDNTYLITGTAFGKQYKNPFQTFLISGDYSYPSSQQSIQMMSWYYYDKSVERRFGLYFSAHDPNGYIKTFTFENSPTECLFKPARDCPCSILLSFYPDNANQPLSKQGWALDYDIAVGVYLGDWWDAAQIYRDWSLNHAMWTKQGPLLRQNVKLPSWFTNTRLWLNTGWSQIDIFNTTTGDPLFVLSKMQKLRQVFGSDNFPITLHWYLWDELPNFDRNYPDYFPAKDKFQDVVQILQQKYDIAVFPYINGRIFDINIPMWETDHADQYAAKRSTQVIDGGKESLSNYIEFYGSETIFATMCPATSYWVNTITSVVKKLVDEYHVKGVYIDQIGAAPPAPCFDPSHGHTTGDGTYWVKGCRNILISSSTSNDNHDIVPIVTEENAEVYIGAATGFLSPLAFLSDDDIPLFAAIYGGYYTSFGQVFEQIDFYPDPDVVACKLSDMFHKGLQLGWFSLGNTFDVTDYLLNPKYQPEIDWIKSLSLWRVMKLGYLLHGRLQRNVDILSKAPVVVSVLKNYNPIMTSLWVSLDNNTWSMGIFISNCIQKELLVEFYLDMNQYYHGNADKFYMYQIFTNGTQSLFTIITSGSPYHYLVNHVPRSIIHYDIRFK